MGRESWGCRQAELVESSLQQQDEHGPWPSPERVSTRGRGSRGWERLAT